MSRWGLLKVVMNCSASRVILIKNSVSHSFLFSFFPFFKYLPCENYVINFFDVFLLFFKYVIRFTDNYVIRILSTGVFVLLILLLVLLLDIPKCVVYCGNGNYKSC